MLQKRVRRVKSGLMIKLPSLPEKFILWINSSLRKNQINFQCTVLDIPASRLGAKLVDMYRKDTTPLEALEQHKVATLAQEHYRKSGTGRPTKKERRDLSDYAQENEENKDWE